MGTIGYIRYCIFLVASNAAIYTTHSITSYTMLPRYSKKYSPEDVERDADSHPLLEESDKRTSSETAPPVYPPSSSSAINAPSGSGSGSEGRHNVEYIYKPVFPREGDDQYAVGVLGKTKQETIEIVQRGIPGLAEFDQSRITFQKHIDVSGTSGRWATILDEAWEHFATDPPSTISVLITDLPGDKKKRDNHHACIACTVVTTLCFVGSAIGGLIYATS